MTQTIEFGLDTFGDVTHANGKPLPHAQVLRDVVAQGVLADQVGVDFIGLGEHHRDDFAISAPEMVMAAIAARTSRIRVGTAVTVLSSDDPIRLFQRLSTLDALSNGRAELILGRGSFTESFPLFGFDLRDYETLFEQKLDLFTRLIRDDKISWSGSHRPALKGQRVYPTPERPLRAWVGVGGSPESVIRAVHFDLPMMLAIIGGSPARFKPFAELYRDAFAQADRPVQPIGVHSPGHIADTDEAARENFFPGYKAMHDRIGRERGWPALQKADFLREVEHGSLYVGSPETVAAKIAGTVKALGLNRFQLKYSAGPVPHAALMRTIELYGTRVIPLVRDMLG